MTKDAAQRRSWTFCEAIKPVQPKQQMSRLINLMIQPDGRNIIKKEKPSD
jgi:hypothetical protein